MTAVTLRQAPSQAESKPEPEEKPQHEPRHAKAHTPLLQKVGNVSIRIPKPVDRALTWVGSHRLFTAAAATTVATGLLALWRPTTPFLVAYGIACWLAGSVWWRGKVAEIRLERNELDVENAKKDEQLRHVVRGDATALTQQLRAIGDLGEGL